MNNKLFIFFLLDTPSGKAYYYDKTGIIQTLVIAAGSIDVTLNNDPGNWLDTELAFNRNETYHGIFISYTTPFDLVRNASKMVKELFLLGYGTEVPLSMAIFKFNSQPKPGEGTYLLYFKGQLDLSKITEQVLETMTINLMESGATQLLKSFETTELQIPCDGSIPENQKILMDGHLVPDVFYYKSSPFITTVGGEREILPQFYISNENDNYGIIHNDPGYDNVFNYAPTTFLKNSPNFIFMSVAPITVVISGYIIVGAKSGTIQFRHDVQTSSKTDLTFMNLVPFTEGITTLPHRFNFNAIVPLLANEKLFITTLAGNEGQDLVVFDGAFSLSFASAPLPTRVWAITFYDYFRLMVDLINDLSTTTAEVFNYKAISNLLQKNSNLFITCGDALRASGDSSYQRYYSLTVQNQILETSFGPQIKFTLKDFFAAVEMLLFADLRSSTDSLEIEDYAEQFDTSSIDLELGELASLKWKFAEDLAFSDLEIGYEPQTYDQQAGKYEWNTTLSMKAPIKSFQKTLTKVTKMRFDSYGIERIRSNVGANTSTTKNGSDTSVFGLNADPSKWVYDYFLAYFTSLVTDITYSGNTNIIFTQNVRAQQILLQVTDGDYFQNNLDQAIIVFSQPAYSATESCNLTISGVINSVDRYPTAPIDYITFSFWHNGVVIYTNTTNVAGINTPIAINHNFSDTFKYEDCIYVTIETSITCEATIGAASLAIGAYVSCSAASIVVNAGTPQQLLSFDTIIPISKPYDNAVSHVQYGFQYFVFNSLVPNTNFNLGLGVQGYIWNQVADFVIKVYINGIVQAETILVHGSNVPPETAVLFAGSIYPQINRDYELNDVVFMTASPLGDVLNVEIFSANLEFTSNYIKAYSLKRVQYDFISGIPNLATDSTGAIRTDIAGAPYNIEDVTPKTVYNKWANYFMSTFMTKVYNDMRFQGLSKNSYLDRQYNDVRITENLNEPILNRTRLFYPIEIEVKVNVPLSFAQTMSKATKAHIHCTFMGTDIYFFADSLTQKPSLNESQTWKGILSPLTNLINFNKITSFQIPDMAPNSFSCAFASPFQFVPFDQSLPIKYKTFSRNYYLFKNQTKNWTDKSNYAQPVQIGDPLPLQFISRDLDPLAYQVFNCDGSLFINYQDLNTVYSPAIYDPHILWQTVIDTTNWPKGNYYIVITGGVGQTAAKMISEPLAVYNDTDAQIAYSFLIEYNNSFNTQGLVFDGATPFVGSKRVQGGFDNRFVEKYIGKTYIDEPQDITVLNAIPYETTTLYIGNRYGGVPDYEARKVLRMLLMDGCTLDGEGFTLDDGASLDTVITTVGVPTKFLKVSIRPTKSLEAISVTATGADMDMSMIATINQQAFGPNISNSSGTTENDLIEITVS